MFGSGLLVLGFRGSFIPGGSSPNARGGHEKILEEFK